jgi:hypothetical protein
MVVLAALVAGVLAMGRRRRASRLPAVPLRGADPAPDDGLYHRPRH